MKLTLILAISLLSTSIFAGTKIVYGEDNRVEWYESDNAMYREIALSTAAMIDKKQIRIFNGEYTLNGGTLRSRLNTCANTRFAEQITAANCSGFLVGEDLLVTAGHCIKDQSDCSKYKWVFDYKLESANDNAKIGLASNVYGCKEIVERKLGVIFSKDDYALIKLDRKVTDRKALEYNKGEKVKKGTELVVIGHPTGLPQKIADGAKVRSTKRQYFLADLDTFGGNSGSAVFNAKTGVVEGILVRGDKDYNQGSCTSVNRVGQNAGSGESVTYIQNIKALGGGGSSWWPF